MSIFTVPPAAAIGAPISDIDTPALLLDLDAFERNLDELQARADAAGMALRPHGKAHKCPAVALAQIARGAVGICCQKVSEAIPFIEAGVRDIHISNEIASPGKARLLAQLACHARMSVCVDDLQQVDWLAAAVQEAGAELTVLVEIDIGHGRCGVADVDLMARIAARIQSLPRLSFGGLQAYHGTVQHVRLPGERQQIIDAANARIRQARARLESEGLPCAVVTGGGTGSADIDFASGVYTELQAGSYAFMDVDYSHNQPSGAGVSSFAHSLFLATRVMSRAAGTHAVLDAGLKSMSLESGMPQVWNAAQARPDAVLACTGVSDEHCTVGGAAEAASTAGATALSALPALGELVLLVPGHVDPTINLHDSLIGYRSGVVEAIWPIAARGLSR
ncbi:DSD1 family PLP-dependent enzyme [Comamonas sp. 17RB]|uniref:DSD1 family PLP-dependent enzyme n=1 Tax=Comamonas sp. 17RB TaxID=3047025 RepID=UPI0024B8731F|nr:DSD1 family PLP-dependent enzyme [Comamonas sp. 17RB]MDI9854308.1 DSD1 family PLP-dependent enzyme [Comamonas sp. 17RB]